MGYTVYYLYPLNSINPFVIHYGHLWLWTMELSANSCSAFAAAPPLPPFDLLANLAARYSPCGAPLRNGTRRI